MGSGYHHPDTKKCDHGTNKRPVCDDCCLRMFSNSISQYRGFLFHLPPLSRLNKIALFGPEHTNFMLNAFHGSLLRKYYSTDPVSLGKVADALMSKTEYDLFTPEELRLFKRDFERFPSPHSFTVRGASNPINTGRMVKAFLNGILLHSDTRSQGKTFADYSEDERRLFPAILADWLDQASYLALEMAAALDYCIETHGWDIPPTMAREEVPLIAIALDSPNPAADEYLDTLVQEELAARGFSTNDSVIIWQTGRPKSRIPYQARTPSAFSSKKTGPAPAPPKTGPAPAPPKTGPIPAPPKTGPIPAPPKTGPVPRPQ